MLVYQRVYTCWWFRYVYENASISSLQFFLCMYHTFCLVKSLKFLEVARPHSPCCSGHTWDSCQIQLLMIIYIYIWQYMGTYHVWWWYVHLEFPHGLWVFLWGNIGSSLTASRCESQLKDPSAEPSQQRVASLWAFGEGNSRNWLVFLWTIAWWIMGEVGELTMLFGRWNPANWLISIISAGAVIGRKTFINLSSGMYCMYM